LVPSAAQPAPEAVSPAEEPHDKSVAPSLKRELDFLENARGDLLQGAPAAALAALNNYDRSFPAGTMKAEAVALRVEALVAAGRREEAAFLARTFLATHPDSPLTGRIRGLFPGGRN
jgi:TolA-binding protein